MEGGLLRYVMQQWRPKGKSRNVGSFHRKELGEALRIGPCFLVKELTPLSSGACGTTSFLRKEAMALRHAALVTLRANT
jgi:hypothetical protein